MKRFIVVIAAVPAILALAVASTGTVGTVAESPQPDTHFVPGGGDTLPPEDPGCPAYGCDQARVLPLSSGGWVIEGHVRFPTTWSSERMPPADYVEVMKFGARNELGVVQEIPIHWSLLNYPHSCPSEWWGEWADVLTIPVEPGDQLELMVATRDQCWAVVEVPSRHDLLQLTPQDYQRGIEITPVGEVGMGR